jgi:hypothetical protein
MCWESRRKEEVVLRALAFLLAWAMVSSGCTYTTSGLYGKKGRSRIRTVAVPTFETVVFEYGLKEQVTAQLIQAFTSDGRVRVVPESEAEAVVRGKVTGFSLDPYQYDRGGQGTQQRAGIVVDVRLITTGEEKTLWEQVGLEGWAIYTYNPATETEARSQAIAEAVAKLCEVIVRGATEG